MPVGNGQVDRAPCYLIPPPGLASRLCPLLTTLSCVAPLTLQLEILGAHARKKAEEAEFKAALAAALAERDTEGRDLVAAYDKVHKNVMRAAGAADDPAAMEEQVRCAAQQEAAPLGVVCSFCDYPVPGARIGLGGCLPTCVRTTAAGRGTVAAVGMG